MGETDISLPVTAIRVAVRSASQPPRSIVRYGRWERSPSTPKPNTALATTQLAVEIGGSWYITTTAYTSPGGNTTWTLQTINFDPSAGAWTNLLFDPGTNTLAAGSVLATPLPSGNINAIGFYNVQNGGKVRIDTFTVNAAAIPEPSALALTGVAVIAACCRGSCAAMLSLSGGRPSDWFYSNLQYRRNPAQYVNVEAILEPGIERIPFVCRSSLCWSPLLRRRNELKFKGCPGTGEVHRRFRVRILREFAGELIVRQ